MSTLDSSKSLAKRKTDTALMPPPAQLPKRQKRPSKVLDEDVYSDAISHIIARDFFPGLLESEAQEDFMQALDSHDSQWIRDAGRRLTQVMTPVADGHRRLGRGTGFTPRYSTSTDNTPRNFSGNTPGQTPATIAGKGGDFAPEETSRVDINMSLGAFQAKYTSEDNESFNALLDKQNDKRAIKYAFFQHGNQIPSARQIAWRGRKQALLEDASDRSTTLNTTRTHGNNQKEPQSVRPSQDLETRPASVDSFPSRQGPNNSLMFGPDGVEDRLSTYAQDRERSSNAPPKSITYTSTRFAATTSPSLNAVPPSPSVSAIDAALAGRPKPTDSESGYTGAETPRVNGYAFVDAEPTPSELGIPVTEEEADAAELEAASKFLPRVDEGGPNPFMLKERSKREDVHMRLVEKADAGRRKGTRLDQLRQLGVTSSPGRTQTPRFSSAPISNKKSAHMTPAAQQLAARIGTPSRPRDGFGTASLERRKGHTPIPVARRNR